MAWNIQPINVNGGPSSNNNCANSNGGGGFETTLDTEYSVAMSNSFGNYQDTSKVYIYEAPADGVNNGNPGLASSTFFALWNAIINDNHVGVMSMSWGAPEDGWSGSDMDTGHNVLNNMLGLGISPTVLRVTTAPMRTRSRTAAGFSIQGLTPMWSRLEVRSYTSTTTAPTTMRRPGIPGAADAAATLSRPAIRHRAPSTTDAG